MSPHHPFIIALLTLLLSTTTTPTLAMAASPAGGSSAAAPPIMPPRPTTTTNTPPPPNSPPAAASDCPIGEDVALSSRRCAGARYLYHEVVQDPLAELLAGAEIIASERVNKAKNAVYPVVAIRTRWMDERIRAALAADPGITQVVLCGAGMDARAYRLPELRGRRVFELDVKPVLEYKAGVLASVADRFPLLAASVQRLDSNFADDAAWLGKLARTGFDPRQKTIWILEGFLYYFEAARAKALLRAIRAQSAPGSLLLADHINDFTLASLKKQAANKWLASTFSSSMEAPEEALPALGFTDDVAVQTVGEEGAHYGLWTIPVVPRAETPDVMRTYLFQARVGGSGGSTEGGL